MSAREFQKNISNFCETLLERNLALGSQSHVIRRFDDGIARVTWVPNMPPITEEGEDGYLRTPDLELSEYLRCLRAGDYSVLLNDGGLIQVSLDFRGDDVIASRFCYIPCAIKFSLDEIRLDDEIYPLEDFIVELPQNELIARLCLRSPFRFEHDPQNVSEKHALHHVHLGKSASRIPVSSAMCWDHFARFVFINFYSEQFDVVADMLKFPVSYRPRSITEAHAMEVHFSFDPPRPGVKETGKRARDGNKRAGRRDKLPR
ncbi:DUF2290 domain-containing protein [Rhizobium sp. CCGE 510]|uniref:DUF2290 domain-containing protein n=1 Tax=Rhizobium sp. CCGE 510 TaxID=1132836 RepID=UPI00027B8A24|nr:DUF2290 domain-containing protein [Rhizobium sp. CCGE 510]EJT06180.1 hypothetical protein RCCGE510_05947 [Rhizobium sp. CCGE 510]